MTTLREAAQQALEFAADIVRGKYKGNAEEIRDALSAALEQPEQCAHESWCASLTRLLTSHPPKPAPCNCNPPRREWRGLTEEEIDAVWEDAQVFNTHYDIARAIEAALKERNA